MHLKITTFSCIKLKNYISQLFLLKILDHVIEINSKIIKSFYAMQENMSADVRIPIREADDFTFTRVKFRLHHM